MHRYINGKGRMSDFTFPARDNWFKSDFSKEEKNGNVKIKLQGITTATPGRVTVRKLTNESVPQRRENICS